LEWPEFLLHLHICVVRTQQARVRVPECVPADDLEQAGTLRSGRDDALQNRVRPVGEFPTVVRGCKHPVRIGSVWRLSAPLMKNSDEFRRKWHRLTPCLRLRIATWLFTIPRPMVSVASRQLKSDHVRPVNSLRPNPRQPARMTITLYRPRW
jgi:hypothetical protein